MKPLDIRSEQKNADLKSLNRYLKDTGYDECDYHLDSKYDEKTPQYKGHFKRALTSVIVSATKAMTDDEENYLDSVKSIAWSEIAIAFRSINKYLWRRGDHVSDHACWWQSRRARPLFVPVDWRMGRPSSDRDQWTLKL